MKNKFLLLGLFFTLIGVAFGFIENTFYQYIDEDGVLHESLFMPLGLIFAAIGLLLILVFSAIKLTQFVRKKSHER
jgi:Na+/melibiose symporter-like transporter